MANWTISSLRDEDLAEFVAAQHLAFVGNSLHYIVYPDEAATVSAYRKAMAGAQNLASGNEIVFLKAVDDASGKIVGGIKVCYYGTEEVRSGSPYAAAKAEIGEGVAEEERYRLTVLNAVMEKRVVDIGYPHSLIDVLFVHPDHHRRGIGQALVGQCCSTSDERGLPGVVEASPIGKRTYELCGYVDKGPVTISPQSWPGKPEHLYYWMERQAAKPS